MATTPYRDEREALEGRLTELQAELSAARKHAEELTQAHVDTARIEREIADVTMKLQRRRRSLLESIVIASPCDASWEAMKGDDRVRFCDSCSKNVYDLSKMTRIEAELLITERETPCVRLFKRRDGTVITSDCPVGLKRRRFRRIVASTIGGGILAAGAMLMRWRSNPTPCAMMQGEPAPMGSTSVETSGVRGRPAVEVVAGGMGPSPADDVKPPSDPTDTSMTATPRPVTAGKPMMPTHTAGRPMLRKP